MPQQSNKVDWIIKKALFRGVTKKVRSSLPKRPSISIVSVQNIFSYFVDLTVLVTNEIHGRDKRFEAFDVVSKNKMKNNTW